MVVFSFCIMILVVIVKMEIVVMQKRKTVCDPCTYAKQCNSWFTLYFSLLCIAKPKSNFLFLSREIPFYLSFYSPLVKSRCHLYRIKNECFILKEKEQISVIVLFRWNCERTMNSDVLQFCAVLATKKVMDSIMH